MLFHSIASWSIQLVKPGKRGITALCTKCIHIIIAQNEISHSFSETIEKKVLSST